MPDPLFQELFSDTAQLRPAPVAQVQARGRQRTRRRNLAVLGATLAMALPAGVAVTLDRPGPDDRDPAVVASTRPAPTTGPTAGPTPTPTPTPPPTPAGTGSGPVDGSRAPANPGSAPATGDPRPPADLTSVPATALLRADDLGGSGWTTSDSAEGDWSLAATIGYCPAGRNLTFYGDPVHRRQRAIGRGGPGAGLVQEVLLFRSGGAQKYYDYHRRGAAVCRTHDSDGGGHRVTMTVVAQGFAGPSLLIRTESQYGRSLHGVVVHGDLATQFLVSDGSEATGRRLGVRARDRLCGAAGTC